MSRVDAVIAALSTRRDLRLLPAAVTGWVAAFVAVTSVTAGWIVAAVGGLVTVAAWATSRRAGDRWRAGAPAVLLAAGVAAAVGIAAGLLGGAHRPADLVDGLPASITADVVVTSSCSATDRGGLVCDAVGTIEPHGADGLARRVGGLPFVMFLDAETARPAFGERLVVSGVARPAEPHEGVAALVDVAAVELRVPPAGVLGWAAGLRAAFAERTTALPGDGGALLPGLAIGDTGRVDTDLDLAMKASSLSHLTAVSGANCAIVVAGVMGLAALLGAGRRARVASAAVALVLFVVLVTPEPSVLRASVMALVALAGIASGRPGGGLPALSAAVGLLLVVDPWLGRDVGFALSVLATGGLLLGAGPLTEWLARRMPSRLAAALALPIAAQLACQPILILLQPSVPVYGVPANLLAAPAAPVATVVGLLACLTVGVAPPIGGLLAWIAWLPAAWVGACARLFSSLPVAQWPWVPGVAGAVLLAALTALLFVGLFARAGPVRLVARLVAAGAVALVTVHGAGAAITRVVDRPTDWSIAACDIGQGDAVLVRSGDAVALIDTGPEPAALRTCLGDLGIRSIDLLVLSHWDADHVDGLPAVDGLVALALVGPVPDEAAQRKRDALAAGGARVVDAGLGDAGRLGAASWRLLWPKRLPHAGEPGNDASLVLEVTGLAGLPPVTLLGDLGADAQRALLATRPVLAHGGIVKVAHHGSADQADALYAELAPVLAIVTVGLDNDYGHPRASILDTLTSLGAAVRRTDTQGLVLVGADADGVWTWTERGG